ncbi:MAG: cobalamin-independent methionine synthase II family protein [Gammaproteobacteria bacterium]|nr:cobalamin-independent methionine synthase II family protein [Gammaproteobacteria bacterium]MBI5617434.1 cobalamin-independent methionine synthase II family protein [Gammaproteobacteria bacterium]
MKRSDQRILTTHVGSLPRDRALSDLLIAEEAGKAVDRAALDRLAEAGVRHCVNQQIASGVDVVNDGEQPRVGFQTYVGQRLEGYGGSSLRDPFKDFADYPDFKQIWLNRGMVMSKVFDAATAQREVKYKDLAPAIREADMFDAALAAAPKAPVDKFMTAASPGIVCTTLRNAYYDTHEAYVRAVARELKKEYELIHSRGYVLQLDCPDLAMEWHGMFQHGTLKQFQDAIAIHIDAINEAISNIPREAVRLHVCWGNYDGPHDCDVPLDDILPIVSQAKVGAFSMEFANPRHQHEYAALGRHPLPKDVILIPGVIDSTVNYIEHPQVVCNRILEAVDAVGDKERVIAGCDCGFGTFAGWEMVAPSIVWKKFEALAEGARLASKKLWG